MPEFEVTVYTKVREVYVVTADSSDAALANWSEGTLSHSECEAVEDFGPVREVSE